jgi:hypothetical protein
MLELRIGWRGPQRILSPMLAVVVGIVLVPVVEDLLFVIFLFSSLSFMFLEDPLLQPSEIASMMRDYYLLEDVFLILLDCWKYVDFYLQ